MPIMMTSEARAARAKYMREWRKKNPEKQREYSAKMWERKAEKLKNNAVKQNTDVNG